MPIAYLGAGDHAAYHDAYAGMLKHFADKPQAGVTCLYACAADPKAGGDPNQLVTWCRVAVAGEQAALEKSRQEK